MSALRTIAIVAATEEMRGDAVELLMLLVLIFPLWLFESIREAFR